MNVLIVNEQKQKLQNLEVDIIKILDGCFDASQIVGMFKDFYFNKMIIDVTAIDGYTMPVNYNTIVKNINPDKIIFFLPEGSELCTSGFLARLINYGIYNFTTNIEGIVYLLNKSNTLKDVEHIKKMADTMQEANNQKASQEMYKTEISNNKVIPIKNNSNQPIVVGVKNITKNAGATSLIYMMKKELSYIYGNSIVALEIDKTDFSYYGDKTMFSITSSEFKDALLKFSNASIILVDMNDYIENPNFTLVINLIEPSIIKLNNLVKRNKKSINQLKPKKVILNKSLLTQKEIAEFEYESGLSILYNMPPLNDRKRNEVILDFLKKLKLVATENGGDNSNRIFGLFRK